MKDGLIIFARPPLPGQVKTRLAEAIGDQAAADCYEAMLREVLGSCRQLMIAETTLYWACTDDELPSLAARYGCTSHRQSSGDLGQRMMTAFSEMFSNGCNSCCIIGSDAPDLPPDFIREAYRLLQHNDVVFGPSRDGGYYLLGMKQLWPQFFAGIRWSSDTVLDSSLATARHSGLTAALLPEWQDIDTVDDLHDYNERCRLAAEVRSR